MFQLSNFRKGDRVELHPATDAWMRGLRYGDVVAIGKAFLRIKMDRGGVLRVPAELIASII